MLEAPLRLCVCFLFFILYSDLNLFFSFADAARKGRVEIVQHLVRLHFLSSYPILPSACHAQPFLRPPALPPSDFARCPT
jgi:hypothetical protein